mgnify:CR=1 FL=1
MAEKEQHIRYRIWVESVKFTLQMKLLRSLQDLQQQMWMELLPWQEISPMSW